jgi:hypothetical protein
MDGDRVWNGNSAESTGSAPTDHPGLSSEETDTGRPEKTEGEPGCMAAVDLDRRAIYDKGKGS